MKLKHVLQRSGGYEDADEDFDATSLGNLANSALQAAGVYGYGDSISEPTEQPWSREISSQDNPNIRSSDAASQSIAMYDPAPVQEKTYNVEAVIDRRRNKPRNALYKIKWDGYDMSNCTWESEISLRQDGIGVLLDVWEKKNKNLCYQRRIPVGFLRDENGKLSTYICSRPLKEGKLSTGIAHSNASKTRENTQKVASAQLSSNTISKSRTGNKSTTDRRLQNKKRPGSQRKQQPTVGIKKKRKRQYSAITQHSSSATSREACLLSHSRSLKTNPKCAKNNRAGTLKNDTLEGEHSTQDCKEKLNKINKLPSAWTQKNNDGDGGILGLFAGLKVPINEVVHCRYKNGKMSNFPDHYPATVLKNNQDGSIDVQFVDGKIIQRRVCRNDVKELRVPLHLFNLRAGDLRVRDRLSAPYIYGGEPVKGWESPSRKVVATLVKVLGISENNNIVVSYAHTGKNKHKEYVDIHSLEFAPRLLEENFIDK